MLMNLFTSTHSISKAVLTNQVHGLYVTDSSAEEQEDCVTQDCVAHHIVFCNAITVLNPASVSYKTRVLTITNLTQVYKSCPGDMQTFRLSYTLRIFLFLIHTILYTTANL